MNNKIGCLIMKEYLLHLNEFNNFFKFLIKKFGKENIFFTFLILYKNGETTVSTFAEDNIKYFEGWIVMQQTKVVSGKIEGISFVLRVFTDKIYKENVPYKEIYSFFFSPSENIVVNRKKDKYGIEIEEVETFIKCLTFNEEENKDNFKYDAFTGEEIPLDPSEIYLNSSYLIEEFLGKEKLK